MKNFMNFKFVVLCALALMTGSAVYGQDNVIDEVVWVVGDEAILKSEVEEARMSAAYEGRKFDGDPYCVIPEEIAVQKLFLHQAALDSIEVPESEVIQRVDYMTNMYIANIGSREKMEEYFNKTSSQIRETLRENAREGLKVQKMQQKLVGEIKITPAEVRRYFKDLPQDSIPYIPTQVEVQIITQQPKIPLEEIEDVIGIEADEAPMISAKNGINTDPVLEMIVKKIPAPTGDKNEPLKALIFDSYYDQYKGAVIFARIMEGTVKKGTKIKLMASGAVEEVVEVGYFEPGQLVPCDELTAGMVGYITAAIKTVKDVNVGDTVTESTRPCAEALPGYKKTNPMVYCGLYPADGAKYPDLRDALEKLQLNDASLQFEPETSIALGFGFRCGFLGLLHLEIIQERLEREYNLDLVTTAPGVIYKVHKTNGDVIELTNPSNLPDPSEIEYMEEPMVKAEIMVTSEFIGAIMDLCQERRGVYEGMEYIEETRAVLHYQLPLNEIIYDFFDALKSRSRGYASLDYEMKGYQTSRLVKLDILINKEEVDALSFIVHEDTAYERGRKMCTKLKEEIPRHMFEVPIQAAIGSKVIARETVKAMRKDVLAKCYGGDISRKRKLLEKQKKGKKRMRQVGNVEIPQEAFMSVLKLDED